MPILFLDEAGMIVIVDDNLSILNEGLPVYTKGIKSENIT